MKRKIVALAFCLSGASFESYAAGLIDINLDLTVAVGTCVGSYANCPVTVSKVQTKNAIGDTVEFTVADRHVTELGKVSEKIEKEIALPTAKGAFTLYSLVPTEGELKDQTIYWLFHNVPQLAGTRAAKRTKIKIYRQLAGESATTWTDVGQMDINRPTVPASFPFEIKPNGTVITKNPQDLAYVIIPLGQKDLKPTTVPSSLKPDIEKA